MKKLALSCVLLFCMFFSFSQQKTIKVICLNKIITEETKYQNGKIVEIKKIDHGYSSVNEQLIRLLVIHLNDIQFNATTDELKNCDYDIIIDSLFTELGSWNSTYVQFINNSTHKKYHTFVKEKFSFDSLTENISLRIVDFAIKSLKDDFGNVFLYNADKQEALYKCNENEIPLRTTPLKASKTVSVLSKNDSFTIITFDKSLQTDDEDNVYFNIKVKSANGSEGWTTTEIVALK